MAGELSVRQVSKFDGQNFSAWKFQLNAVLIAHDLLEIVNDTRIKPADVTSAPGKAWIKDNAKVMFLISSVMEPTQLNCLLSCVSAKEMWDKLSTIHEQKTATHKLMLMQRFHEYKMDTSDSVAQHVAKIQNLADLGENFPAIVVISKILTSLPAKYRHLRTAWSSVAVDRQTVDHLLERLIEEESLLRNDEEESVALAAVTRHKSQGVSNAKDDKSQSNNHDKKNFKCFECHKKGHYARNCPDKKNNRESSLTMNTS